ncbi:uncharacterized protein LOC142330443 [Lycorma delicatula]|uniref:uncharacterized protein LOC142330443 n=1 Tax=Lycorma delicatula TaxID=130591 RepID=UPI003F510F24
MDAQTSNLVWEENPLALPIKIENVHESGQQEYLFVHLAKTDDVLTIFKQSMDVQTDSSFFDEDPLSSSIKKEIKHETERTEHMIAPVAMTDDKLSTSRQNHIEEVTDVEKRVTESSLKTSKCVVCNKLKYKCICDNVIDDLNSFSFKEKCLQMTEKPVKVRNVISCHLPIHTCVLCQESFSQRSTLESHLSIHVVKKNLTCNFCKKSFSQRSELKTHLFIHTDEKKFTSNFCKKTFNHSSNLKAHLSIHTDEKKFTCNFCKKSFSQRSELKTHLFIHTDEKKFTLLSAVALNANSTGLSLSYCLAAAGCDTRCPNTT